MILTYNQLGEGAAITSTKACHAVLPHNNGIVTFPPTCLKLTSPESSVYPPKGTKSAND